MVPPLEREFGMPVQTSSLTVNSTFATTLGRFFSTQASKSLPFLFPSVHYLHSESPPVARYCSVQFCMHADLCISALPRLLKHRAVTYTSRIRSIYDYFSCARSFYFVHSVFTQVSVVRHSSLIYSWCNYYIHITMQHTSTVTWRKAALPFILI